MISRFLLSLLATFIFSNEIHNNTLLFCLDKNEPILGLDSDGLL